MYRNEKMLINNPTISLITDPRLAQEIKRENDEAIARLNYIKRKRKTLYSDMIALTANMKAFDEYKKKESIKIKHLFETIPECKNAVDESIRKQEDHHKKIMQLRNSTDRLKKIQHLATTRIEKLRPFEELISKVIENNPRYKNVYDIINHIEEMSETRKNQSLQSQLPHQISSEIQKKPDEYNENKKTYSNPNIIPNQVNKFYLMTELQKVQQISEEVDIDRAKQRFKKMHEETFLTLHSISDQYKNLCARNLIKKPLQMPREDLQLAAIIEYFTETLQRLEIYNNLRSGELKNPMYYKYMAKEKKKP